MVEMVDVMLCVVHVHKVLNGQNHTGLLRDLDTQEKL